MHCGELYAEDLLKVYMNTRDNVEYVFESIYVKSSNSSDTMSARLFYKLFLSLFSCELSWMSGCKMMNQLSEYE